MRRARPSSLWLVTAVVSVVALGLPVAAFADSTFVVYHGNAQRTGDVKTAASLLPSTRAWSAALDGAVYAEPLVAAGRVYTATENDSVYALDANNGRVLWRHHLGPPMRNVVSQVGCGDIDPLGITSTPVISPTLNLVFVVEAVQGSPGHIHHELVGLDMTTGAVRMAANADPGGVQNPLYIQQRAALALANGRVYVGFGGYAGDCGPYHGWLVSLDTSGGHKVAFDVSPHDGLGAIWETGGPAVDGAGDVYVGTGNNDPHPATHDYGESVLKFSPALHLLHNFSGSNAVDDEDLGTTTPALVGGNMVFEVGKQHVGYLLAASDLHKMQQLTVCPTSEAKGADAFDGHHLYVPCDAGIQEVDIDTVHHSMTLGWTGPATSNAGPPLLAGGALWSVDWGADKLYALNPATGASLTGFPIALGGVPHFAAPSSALGLILIGTDNGVTAYRGPSGAPPHALGAPRSVTAAGGHSEAAVHWRAPANPAAAPVTGYAVTPFVGTTPQARHVFSGTATSHVIAGLASHKTYTFRVAALNRVGTGPDSAPSKPVTVT